MAPHNPSRRDILRGAGGLTAALALGSAGALAAAGPASAVGPGDLTIAWSDETDPRMFRYRFATPAVTGAPGVNVLLPEDYGTGNRRYPVLYLFHGGGGGDATTFDRLGVRDWAAGLPLIVVMPDGGVAGWYSNPVGSHVGPRNWESFHVGQLIPWVDAAFRTHAGADGRAVSGFSMGGFGALKYAAKYPGLFSSVSSHSGPADLRRDSGIVGHWANLSSAATELGGATVYGAPLWNESRVSADNPVEHVESYRGKRVFLVVGTNGDAVPWFSAVQEQHVRNGHRGFRSLMNGAGIPHMAYEEPGGHVLRHPRVRQDLAGVAAHLRPAT
ncbi:alpha/beta hydrolase [Streptomyces sp. NPDC006270]|uniref:alpha/beta hydrolase n=1 Tax=Streptomyces sp. NPDC006270 TaxID=3364741 RepID=UPI0036C91AFB